MYTKSLTIMAALTASIARADLFIQEQLAENVQGRDLKAVAKEEVGDASGIFGLFDVDSNGSIQPTEITTAYKFMNTKANDNLKQNELLKAMDGQIRAFCGVGAATEAEIKEEQEDEDNDESEDDEEEKPRNGRKNRGGRRNRNNRGKKGRGGRGNRGGVQGGGSEEFETEDESNMQGEDQITNEFPEMENHDMPAMPDLQGEGGNHDSTEYKFEEGKEPDFKDEKYDFNDESLFEDDGEGGRRLRAGKGRGGKRAKKGSWRKQMRSRANKGRRGGNRGAKNQRRGGKKCRRCGKVSRKSLAKKRMSKGLFGMLDANHNKNISLKEMFRPFSMADKDFDYNVTLAEFNQSMTKAKKPICRQYIRKARKTAIKTWFEMGVPEAERKGKN